MRSSGVGRISFTQQYRGKRQVESNSVSDQGIDSGIEWRTG
jgi:hypothetical protein